MSFVPTIRAQHTFQQVWMIEQGCHPDIAPPISTKGTLSRVFTCISPGTDCGLKCVWTHLTSPFGAEDTYLPTSQVGWNNRRTTMSLVPSPWATSWVHFQTLPALLTLRGTDCFNRPHYICTNSCTTEWTHFTAPCRRWILLPQCWNSTGFSRWWAGSQNASQIEPPGRADPH